MIVGIKVKASATKKKSSKIREKKILLAQCHISEGSLCFHVPEVHTFLLVIYINILKKNIYSHVFIFQ